MPWFQNLSERQKGAGIGGLIVSAVGGIIVAAITNSDKLSAAYDKYLAGNPPPSINGDWFGVFRESSLNQPGWVTSAENVKLDLQKGKIDYRQCIDWGSVGALA
jgi:hypothetical protein